MEEERWGDFGQDWSARKAQVISAAAKKSPARRQVRGRDGAPGPCGRPPASRPSPAALGCAVSPGPALLCVAAVGSYALRPNPAPKSAGPETAIPLSRWKALRPRWLLLLPVTACVPAEARLS